ncbi:MAG: hypothetical protein ACK6BM_03190 [Cyanobacteriota bacterium]
MERHRLPLSTSIRMLVARAVAPEAKHLGVAGLLVLRPEGQGQAQGPLPGDAPLPPEGVQLLEGGLGEVDERAYR